MPPFFHMNRGKEFIQRLLYFPTLVIKKTEILSAFACRLVYYTGKYHVPLHPKHLHDLGKEWYLELLKPGNTVLDIGCHTGQHTFAAARKSKKVVALDIDIDSLTQAKNDARRQRIHNVQFFQHNVNHKLPFAKNTFDTVIFFAVLEHLLQRDLAIQEVWRVLKKEGHLFLSVPNKTTLWKSWQKTVGLPSFSDPDHKTEYTKKGIVNLLRRHKFVVLHVEPVAFDMPFVGVIDLIGGISISLYKFLSKLRYWLVMRFPSQTTSFQIIAQKK